MLLDLLCAIFRGGWDWGYVGQGKQSYKSRVHLLQPAKQTVDSRMIFLCVFLCDFSTSFHTFPKLIWSRRDFCYQLWAHRRLFPWDLFNGYLVPYHFSCRLCSLGLLDNAQLCSQPLYLGICPWSSGSRVKYCYQCFLGSPTLRFLTISFTTHCYSWCPIPCLLPYNPAPSVFQIFVSFQSVWNFLLALFPPIISFYSLQSPRGKEETLSYILKSTY